MYNVCYIYPYTNLSVRILLHRFNSLEDPGFSPCHIQEARVSCRFPRIMGYHFQLNFSLISKTQMMFECLMSLSLKYKVQDCLVLNFNSISSCRLYVFGCQMCFYDGLISLHIPLIVNRVNPLFTRIVNKKLYC